jgi:hypothetical protein
VTEHRAIQALKAVKSILIAANTRAKANVEIGRTADITESDAITIEPAEDSPINEFGTDNTSTIDSVQRIFIDLHAQDASHEEAVLEHVYELRAQVHTALLTDYTLGLAFVIAIRYQGTEQIAVEGQGTRLGSMRTIWDVAYRMLYANPAT